MIVSFVSCLQFVLVGKGHEAKINPPNSHQRQAENFQFLIDYFLFEISEISVHSVAGNSYLIFLPILLLCFGDCHGQRRWPRNDDISVMCFRAGVMKEKIKVLFLCTGNSCRSQIAEGWARHLKGDVIEAYSAGVSPGELNSRAVSVMAEAGVDISMHRPKHVDELLGIDFDYVVTVCNNARDTCPVFPGRTGRIHKLFHDPSFMEGSEEQIMAALRELRDGIRAFVEEMPESLEKLAKENYEQKE